MPIGKKALSIEKVRQIENCDREQGRRQGWKEEGKTAIQNRKEMRYKYICKKMNITTI